MNRGGTGPRSTILMRRTQVGPPTALRELNLGTVTANSITISWESPDSTGGVDITITEYIVSWREVVDGTNEFKTTRVSGLARNHVIKDLNTITTSYQIAVAAVNSEELTGPRSEVFSRTLPRPPRNLMLESSRECDNQQYYRLVGSLRCPSPRILQNISFIGMHWVGVLCLSLVPQCLLRKQAMSLQD